MRSRIAALFKEAHPAFKDDSGLHGSCITHLREKRITTRLSISSASTWNRTIINWSSISGSWLAA